MLSRCLVKFTMVPSKASMGQYANMGHVNCNDLQSLHVALERYAKM